MLKLLTNHSRLVLDMQIILPPLELQVHVAKDNGILRDVCSKKSRWNEQNKNNDENSDSSKFEKTSYL